MHVVECEFPSGIKLSRDVVRNAYFHGSYRAALTRPDAGIVDVFFALFGHTPLWMKVLLIAATRGEGLRPGDPNSARSFH
jgi:hypothetical protein